MQDQDPPDDFMSRLRAAKERDRIEVERRRSQHVEAAAARERAQAIEEARVRRDIDAFVELMKRPGAAAPQPIERWRWKKRVRPRLDADQRRDRARGFAIGAHAGQKLVVFEVARGWEVHREETTGDGWSGEITLYWLSTSGELWKVESALGASEYQPEGGSTLLPRLPDPQWLVDFAVRHGPPTD